MSATIPQISLDMLLDTLGFGSDLVGFFRMERQFIRFDAHQTQGHQPRQSIVR